MIAGGEEIRLPVLSRNVHKDVELVVAIGKEGKNIKAGKAFDFVVGYAIGLDMTLRDVQNEAKEEGHPWTVSKGFDTSAPLSNVIPKERISDPQKLTIICKVNGTVKQQGCTGDMVYPIEKIIEYAS